MTKRIFISADHGMAIIYFLQSDVVSTLLDAGVEVIVLTDEALVPQLATRNTVSPLKVCASNKPINTQKPSARAFNPC